MKKHNKHNNHNKHKSGGKFKAGSKKRENKRVLMFDDKERQEFLTGFHKRKVERRKAALKEIKDKLKEEQKRVREERHKEYLKMLKERREALEEEDELDDAVTATTESVQYDHPNHTVTVTTISDLDLSNARLLESLTSQEQQEKEDENDEEEKVAALPKKAGNPLMSKKIQSLTSSLNAFTKNQQQKKNRSKGKRDVRGRGHQFDKKSSVATGNKLRQGRTTKKQRRKRTGWRERKQD